MAVVQRLAAFITRKGWYLNFVAHPEVTVETRGAHGRCRARIADAAEETALWPRLDVVYPTFAVYRRRTAKAIHIIELSPVADSGAGVCGARAA